MLVNDSSGITYTIGSGTFTLTTPGNYLVNWQINVNQGAAGEVSFGLNVGGNIIASVPAYLERGQISGSAFVPVTTSGTTLSLLNNGTTAVNYDTALNVRANIVITQVA